MTPEDTQADTSEMASAFDEIAAEDDVQDDVVKMPEGFDEAAAGDIDEAYMKSAPDVTAAPAAPGAPEPAAKAAEPAKKESFGEAFARNRKAGEKTFTWNGKSYTTDTADGKSTAKPVAKPEIAAPIRENTAIQKAAPAAQPPVDAKAPPKDSYKPIGAQAKLGDSPSFAKQPFGPRRDGTPKGMGYLGVLKTPKGESMTEYTIGVNIDGKEMDIPSLVPTLTAAEVDHITSTGQITDAIQQKAVAHAKSRLKAGKSVFAD